MPIGVYKHKVNQGFQKGHASFLPKGVFSKLKGRHFSEERNERISLSLKEKYRSGERVAWNKGKILRTDVLREKECISCKTNFIIKSSKWGQKFCSNACAIWGRVGGWKLSDESRKNIARASRGREVSDETRRKIGLAHSKEKSAFWKGGVTPVNKAIRMSLEYKLWRESVFKRDEYTCQICGTKSGGGKAVELQADHIKPFAFYPDLRFNVLNGRTLCRECHMKTDTWGRPKES